MDSMVIVRVILQVAIFAGGPVGAIARSPELPPNTS